MNKDALIPYHAFTHRIDLRRKHMPETKKNNFIRFLKIMQ